MDDDYDLDSDDDDHLRMLTPYVGDDIRGPPPVADVGLRQRSIPVMSLPQDRPMEHPQSNKVVSPTESVIDVVGGVEEDFALPEPRSVVRSDVAEAGDEAAYFTDEEMDRTMPTLNNETLQVGEEDSVYLDRASAPPSTLPDIVEPIRPIPLRRMPSPE